MAFFGQFATEAVSIYQCLKVYGGVNVGKNTSRIYTVRLEVTMGVAIHNFPSICSHFSSIVTTS